MILLDGSRGGYRRNVVQTGRIPDRTDREHS